MKFTLAIEGVEPEEKCPVWPAAKVVLMVKVLSMIVNIMEESGIAMNLEEESLTPMHQAFLDELVPLDKKQYMASWDAFAENYLDWFKDYMASLDTGDVTDFTIPLSFDDARDDMIIYTTFVFVRSRSLSLADRNQLRLSLYWCASVASSIIEFAKAENQEIGEQCEEVAWFLTEVCYALDNISKYEQEACFQFVEDL